MAENNKENKIKEQECNQTNCCNESCDCNKEKHHAKKHHEKCKKDTHKEEIEKLEKERDEAISKAQYAAAELINYRKRKDEELATYRKYCNQDLITELIPIIDNFERAINLDDNNLDDELSKFLQGFKMMYASLSEVMKKYGVEEISRNGEVFDPKLEEALMIDNIPELDDDVVSEVLLKGYKLYDRVIRPASVKINKKDN